MSASLSAEDSDDQIEVVVGGQPVDEGATVRAPVGRGSDSNDPSSVLVHPIRIAHAISTPRYGILDYELRI